MVTNIALYSWNIDFTLPFPEARMKAALVHLNSMTSLARQSLSTAAVIFLQECTTSDLNTIALTPWIRDHFYVTDMDARNWATASYGTTILIDRRLVVIGAFRVHYSQTIMERDAFFVDVSVGEHINTLRLCNTHLESLAVNPPLRPAQMKVVAHYLQAPGVYAGVVAGDFNAIQPFDYMLHENGNNLKDAFLELGGKEQAEEGFTWGQQATTLLREQFGCSRMDKVYFCGYVKVSSFERFGQDVLIEGEDEQTRLVELGFDKPWVTDHLGIKADLQLLPCKNN